MKTAIKGISLLVAGFLLGMIAWYISHVVNNRHLSIWHMEKLPAEMTSADITRMSGLEEYLDREERLFGQLDEKIYRKRPDGLTAPLDRYLTGSWSDPHGRDVNWNRTVILSAAIPRANVLMLHGLSDSPYSLRGLAEKLHTYDCNVLVLRLPGHGTIPSGLANVEWQDFSAAVRLAVRELTAQSSPAVPFYIVGYSNGAALAVEYSLSEILGEPERRPDGLFLISPAITVSPTAALAKWNLLLAGLPGLQKLAWLSIEPEYDPYKYNSFAINAGKQIYALTRHIQSLIKKIDRGGGIEGFPPVVALMSAVDATVPPRGLIDRFMKRLQPNNHKLVLFDVNRGAVDMALIKDSGRPLVEELMSRPLPFTVALLTNRTEKERKIEMREKAAAQTAITHIPTDLSWPVGIYSLSHVALPFPLTDPIYGIKPEGNFSLGMLEPRGEKNVLQIPLSNLLRLRCNPFYEIVEQQILGRIVSD